MYSIKTKKLNMKELSNFVSAVDNTIDFNAVRCDFDTFFYTNLSFDLIDKFNLNEDKVMLHFNCNIISFINLTLKELNSVNALIGGDSEIIEHTTRVDSFEELY